MRRESGERAASQVAWKRTVMKARGCIETIDGDLLVDTCAFTLRAVEHLPDWRRRDAYPHACIRDVGKGSSAVKTIPWEQKANTEIGIRARTKGRGGVRVTPTGGEAAAVGHFEHGPETSRKCRA